MTGDMGTEGEISGNAKNTVFYRFIFMHFYTIRATCNMCVSPFGAGAMFEHVVSLFFLPDHQRTYGISQRFKIKAESLTSQMV